MFRFAIGLPVMAASIVVSSLAFAEPDEIVVTASPLKGDKIAVPVAQLDQAAIDARGGASLGDLLGDQPGVSQSGFAPGASRPIIRGLDNFRVRIQENGIASQGVSALSEDHGAPIDPLMAEKVEVLRGPATLRYGSQAIGGVVTVLNNRIPKGAPDSGFEGKAFAALSTVDEGREGALHVDAAAGPFVLHADGFFRDAEDYETAGPSGTSPNSKTRMEGFTIGGSHIGENGYIGLSGGRFESKYGVPASGERVFIAMRQTRYNVAGAFFGFSFEGGWSDYTHDEVGGTDGKIGSTFNNEEWEGRAEYLHAGLFGTGGAVGVQAAHRSLSAGGEGGHLLAPANGQSWAGFAFEELPLGPAMMLQMAGRVERVKQQGFGVMPPQFDGVALGQEIDAYGKQADKAFTLFSGSLGLVKELNDTRELRASVQVTERAPAIPELFSKGGHEATETFEIGNPNLRKERAYSAELGLSDDDFSITAFYTRFNGFIFKDFTGFVCGEEFETCGVEDAPGVEEELTQIVFTQRDARHYGVEAEGTLWLGEAHGFAIGAVGRFDLVRAKLEGGANVPRIPPMRLGGGLRAEGEFVTANMMLTHIFDQTRLGQNETRTEGYNDLTAQVVWQPFVDQGLLVGVSGRNLLDEAARNHVSFLKDEVLMPGRNLRLFVRAYF